MFSHVIFIGQSDLSSYKLAKVAFMVLILCFQGRHVTSEVKANSPTSPVSALTWFLELRKDFGSAVKGDIWSFRKS